MARTKVLALFGRAEPRDFIDLAELTKRFPLAELIDLASEKDPGLDLAALEEFMQGASRLPRAEFELDDAAYEALLETVQSWRTDLRHQLEQAPDSADTPEAGRSPEP